MMVTRLRSRKRSEKFGYPNDTQVNIYIIKQIIWKWTLLFLLYIYGSHGLPILQKKTFL